MATIRPFAALRPKPELAAQICELPYDVMSSDEARELASGNPLSFLHVSKPEIDLPRGTDLYSPSVYAKGKENFQRLISQGALRQDAQPSFYFYRQVMGRHSQTGLVAAASCRDYLENHIKKHELTRPDKEDDRVRHIETLAAQTGPVFLTYRADPALDAIAVRQCAAAPEIDFTAPDGVRHSAWTVSDPEEQAAISHAFARMSALYIADGHHRSAAAARVFQARTKGSPATESSDGAYFLSVIFPHHQMQILPYNRVLKDLNGHSPEQLLQKLEAALGQPVRPAEAARAPQLTAKHDLGFYLAGRWYRLKLQPGPADRSDLTAQLDVSLLQNHILGPVFGIADPRTSTRIGFVGGIRGTAELEKRVISGEDACAFSMFPTSIEDLMAIADAGGIMPPKSTWFEPKLRDAMFCHLI